MQTPSWVTDLRAQAPVTAACTYLDCAYDCGGTTLAAAAAQDYFADWARAAAAVERGGPGRETFFRLADETRAQICALIGAADPRGVCFTRNTNEGISHILMGFDDFRPGDNILVCDIEHPSVLMPCLNAQKLRGVEARVLPPVDGEYLPAELFMGACDDHTRMILLSHVQSSNGCKADLAALGDFCRQRGIYLVVDAIQSLGFSVFEAEKWGVSAVSAGGYKGLLAGESSAFLWCAPDLLAHIWPVYTAAGPALTVDRAGVYHVNFYQDATVTLDGATFEIAGNYPVGNVVTVKVSGRKDAKVEFRRPAWCPKLDVARAGDAYTLTFDMNPRLLDGPDTVTAEKKGWHYTRYLHNYRAWKNAISDSYRATPAATVMWGPLLLAKSRRTGASLNELTDLATVRGQGYSVKLTPSTGDGVWGAWDVELTKPGAPAIRAKACDYQSAGDEPFADGTVRFSVWF